MQERSEGAGTYEDWPEVSFEACSFREGSFPNEAYASHQENYRVARGQGAGPQRS